MLLAGVSHDLRSPLSRIRMAAELLPETDGIAPRRASIVRNVDVADRLIASFLDYVRAAELPLESTVDVVAIARHLLESRDEPADVLTIVAPARLDVTRTHALLLERLLADLVDNAMRHGKPPVLIRLRADGGERGARRRGPRPRHRTGRPRAPDAGLRARRRKPRHAWHRAGPGDRAADRAAHGRHAVVRGRRRRAVRACSLAEALSERR